MLFRIQSLWLLVAAITLGLIFVLDLYRFPNGQEITILNQYINTIVAALNVVIILLAIFKFKQLKSQSHFVLLSILLNLALIGLIFWDINSKNSTQDLMANSHSSHFLGGDFLLGAFTPIASIFFACLAFRGIKKDQKVIKDSYQRLR